MQHNFKQLLIWKKSRRLVRNIYELTNSLPDHELYGLTSQMRRAAISMPANISEGCGRSTVKQLSHFLDIAIGSSCELETLLYLALDLGYIDEQESSSTNNKIVEIRRMIIGFKNRLS